MGWSFDYSVNDTRGASAGTALSDLGEVVRVLPEGGASKRDANVIVPFRHGNVGDVVKWWDVFTIPLEVQLRYTDDTGAVVHSAGRPGHVYENWHLLKALLAGQTSQLWFGRTDPHIGAIEIPVEVLVAPVSTTPRNRIFAQLKTRWPFWSDETQRTGLGTSFTLGGTAPVADMLLTITGGTDVKVTHDQSGDWVLIDGATPAGGVLIDCGLRKATYVTGGANAEPLLSRNTRYWFQLWPGSNTFTVTGGGSISIDLYEQYL